MFKNSNNVSINRLSDKSFKANNTRNIFAIIAIVLTTVLFVTVTTLTLSIIEELNFEKFRKVGTTAHGYIKSPTKDEVQKIKNSSLVKTAGEITQVAKNIYHPKVDKAKIMFCYLDSEALSMMVYDNLKGTWPSKEDEIALPTWILDKLGLNYTLGQKITFGYDQMYKKEGAKDIEKITNMMCKEFTLSAYYTEYTNTESGDKGFGIISKVFKDNLGGQADLFVTLKKKDNLSLNFDKVCSDAGINKDRYSLSSSYRTVENRSLADVAPYIAMVILILVCGYLLIYNIFYISVSKDIKFYGLLKTVGTTSRQLKVIVRNQCLKLCIIGIPIGLIIGYGIGFIVVPLAMRMVNVSSFKVSFNPLIFILTTLFSLVTVILACRKPAKLAGKVSPIEAVRFTSVEIRKKKDTKNGSKGAKIYKMAWANVFRDRKRAIIVLLSLTLGFICFICAATFSKSLQADAYLERYVPNDFTIENKMLESFGKKFEEREEFIDDKMYNRLKKIEEVKEINRVKLVKAELKYEGVLKKNSDEWTKNIKEDIKVTSVDSNILGVKANIFDNLKRYFLEGEINKDKFESGEYVVVSGVANNAIKVGDKMDIGTKENPKEVEVMAVLRRNTFTHTFSNGPDILLAYELAEKLYPNSKTLIVSMKVKNGSNEAVYAKLKDIIGVTSNVNIEAKHLEKEEFIKAQRGIFIALGGLSLVIALIGALNFINTMITSINARRVELAMLESVGMTNKQMRNMITLEGIYYGIISLFMVGTLGNVMAYYLIEAFKHEADYAKYYFPTMPLIGIAVFVAIISLLVPKIIFKAIIKESIVDRLRDLS